MEGRLNGMSLNTENNGPLEIDKVIDRLLLSPTLEAPISPSMLSTTGSFETLGRSNSFKRPIKHNKRTTTPSPTPTPNPSSSPLLQTPSLTRSSSRSSSRGPNVEFLSKELETAQGTITKLTATVCELHKKVTRKDKEAATLKEEVAWWTEMLEGERTQRKEEREELMSQIRRLKGMLDDVTKESTTATDLSVTPNTALDITAVVKKDDHHMSLIKSLQRQLSECTSQLTHQIALATQHESHVRQLESQVEELIKENAELQEDLIERKEDAGLAGSSRTANKASSIFPPRVSSVAGLIPAGGVGGEGEKKNLASELIGVAVNSSEGELEKLKRENAVLVEQVVATLEALNKLNAG